MAKRTKATRSAAELLRDYGPAAASMAAVVISVASYLQTLRVQSDADARERVRAEIYFEGAAPTEWCKQAQTAEAMAACGMLVKPVDPAMRILRTMVQYPATEFPDGSRSYDESYGGNFVISLAKRTEFLANRSRRLHDIDKDSKVMLTGVLPITILSQYTYNGKKYWDSSAYNIHYAVSNVGGRQIAVPGNLTYCGRLKQNWPTFLVDPWFPTAIGFGSQKSTGLMFECMGKATWFSIERGRYVISSDLSAKVQANPPALGDVPLDVRSFTSTPIGTVGTMRTHQVQLE